MDHTLREKKTLEVHCHCLSSRLNGVPIFFNIFHCESYSYNCSLLVSLGKVGKELYLRVLKI